MSVVSDESAAFDEKVKKNFTEDQYRYIRNHFKEFQEVMSEPTDDRRLGKIAEKLFIARLGSPAEGVELAEKIKRFGKDTGSLEERAAHLGFTGKDAVKDFKDAYFSRNTPKSTRDQWFTLLEDRYGSGTYNKTVDDLRKLEHDEMSAKIARDRERTMEGYDPETGEMIPKEWLESAIMGIVLPRQKQAYIEGRDPTKSEVAMDALSNAAYAFPVGSIEKAIVQHSPRLLSTVSKYATPVITNALAPAAVAVGDYALGSKPYANAKDAAIDVGLGLATNLMANKGVATLGSRLLGGATGSANTDKGIRKTLAQMLDGLPTEREVAEQEVRDATSRAKATLSNKKPLSESDKSQLLDDLIVAEYGRIMKQDKAAKGNLSGRIALSKYAMSQEAPGGWKQIGKKPLSELDLVAALEGYYKADIPESYGQEAKLLSRLNKDQRREQLVTDNPFDPQKVLNPPPKPDNNLGTFLHDVPKAESKEGKEYFIREALRNHPELEALVAPAGKKDKVRNVLVGVKNFSVNKIGNDSDASRLVNVLPGMDVEGWRKFQKEMREEARKKAMEKAIGGKK